MEALTEAGVVAGSIEKTKLCVALFIASESTFFGYLILAYVFFHGFISSGPTAANSLHPASTGVYTAFLIASSGTVWLAGRSLRKQNRRGFLLWLSVTIAMGLVFLYGETREYLHLLSQQVTISRNLFGTTYFGLTGMHGIHVIIGLTLLSIVLGIDLTRDRGARYQVAVESVSMYWHFVDCVWIAVFSIVYLWSTR